MIKRRDSIQPEGDMLQLTPLSFLESKDSVALKKSSRFLRKGADEEYGSSLLFSLLRFPREFKKIRAANHLSRLVLCEYYFKKKLLGVVTGVSQRRHLFLRLYQARLEYPFGSKSVLGIFVLFNLIRQREAFEEQHILAAIRRIIPDVNVVKGSFLDYEDRRNQFHNVYLEIEREENFKFSQEEMQRLKKELPSELEGCIEQLVPTTFMRRNEEEVYRTILTLREELRSVKDIPQVNITFEEQGGIELFFTVILVRLVKGSHEPALKELFEKQHPEILFLLDRVDAVGYLRKTILKEATVFRLQIPKNPFFRKDRSVNLYKARSYVVSLLTRAFGPIRDFNGGLISKQSERLEDFLALMPDLHDEFLPENFFYSITPIVMQSLLPADLIKHWFMASLRLLAHELPRDKPFLTEELYVEGAFILVVSSNDVSFKEELSSGVSELEISSLELGAAEITQSGFLCMGFLYQPSEPGKEALLRDHVLKIMENWASRKIEENVLKLCLKGSEITLDPRLSKGDQSYIIIKMLFEGLTRMTPKGPELAIAKSCEASEDHKRYVFHLRDSKWSNGAPITAYDFEYSWKKALQPAAPSVFSSNFFLIKNAKKAKDNLVTIDEVGIHALDAKTLVVELESPAPFFLEMTAHATYALINSFIDRKYPGWAYQAGDTYVSNGPFKLVQWKHKRAITVMKNPEYWDAESVTLDKVTINFVDTVTDEMRLFQQGESDLLGRPLNSIKPSLHFTAPDIEKVTYPLLGTFMLWFNTKTGLFANRKIRKAFAMATNKSAFRSAIGHEMTDIAHSILPKKLSLCAENLLPTFDLEGARRMFQEGLSEIGATAKDFSKLSLCFASDMYREPLFKVLAEQWETAFGMHVVLESYQWKEHFERLVNRGFEIGGMELRALWNDPGHLLEYFRNSRDLLNISGFENDEFMEAMNQSKQAASVLERKHYLALAEAILARETPGIPLYELSGSYYKKDSLKNVYTSEFFEIDFKWAKYEKMRQLSRDSVSTSSLQRM